MKIGDKVRFLNDIGGGVITGFKDKETAWVEDDSGFDFPVSLRELVVIETDDYNIAKKEVITDKKKTESLVVGRAVIEEPVFEEKGRDVLNVYLGFVPENSRELQTTDFEGYLINDSNYYLYYTYQSEKDGRWHLRSHGLLEPNSKLMIEKFERQQLNDLEFVALQLIPFKHDKEYDLKPAVSVEIKIDVVKFYKLHVFKDTEFFPEPALLYDVIKDDYPFQSVTINPISIKEAIALQKRIDTTPEKQQSKKHKEKSKVIEVDLHIHELLDTTQGMSNKDILEYQLKEFNAVMDEHKNKKGQRIVFIHGKGDGVLRKAIADELKKKYNRFNVQDASFKEYGFGATMVTIR
ncbi:MAG: DUF2027 domain-containing protein [Bacteroidales bacterium]|nr:DUF2027 domain-containing protein [Bacteroidales bacterium]